MKYGFRGSQRYDRSSRSKLLTEISILLSEAHSGLCETSMMELI